MTAGALAARPPAAWRVVPGPPPFAAPLTALDRWCRLPCEPGRDELVLASRTAVRGTDPALRGHFPGLTVLPGVFVLEAVGQLLALAAGPVPLQCLRSVRFLAPLLDGDELDLHVVATPVQRGFEVTATGRTAAGEVAVRLRAAFGPRADDAAEAVNPVTAPDRGLDHGTVRALLPQRHPLLLVDRVLEVADDCIVTEKAVTATEPCYAHVSDDAPAHAHDLPASLLLESLGQSAALHWFATRPVDPDDGATLMFVAARDLRLTGAARPGDVLRHRVVVESVRAGTAVAVGETWVGGRRIATVASLVATRRPVAPPRH